MEFIFDEEKNRKLFEQRRLTFERIIEAILDDKVLLDIAHPNQERYPKQRLMIIDLDNYTYGVPYLRNKKEVVLKTIYPDRRYKKLLEKKDDKN
jgi:uncharacterized DUF497 family protein